MECPVRQKKIEKGTLFENVDVECHPGVVQLVTAMAVPEAMRDALLINTFISEQDYRKGMRGWKETTSTSPNSRHLGHYKAALQDIEDIK